MSYNIIALFFIMLQVKIVMPLLHISLFLTPLRTLFLLVRVVFIVTLVKICHRFSKDLCLACHTSLLLTHLSNTSSEKKSNFDTQSGSCWDGRKSSGNGSYGSADS